MPRILANASRLLSRMTGGAENTTLCHRAAMRWGWDCLFCRAEGRWADAAIGRGFLAAYEAWAVVSHVRTIHPFFLAKLSSRRRSRRSVVQYSGSRLL